CASEGRYDYDGRFAYW
nr:immunoglobulin heavy chain junction region [Mus musculus]